MNTESIPSKFYIVHVLGVLLILNSLNTYFFLFLGEFIGCSARELMTHCDVVLVGPLLEFFGNIAQINLLIRFMAGIGFVLDILPLAYFLWGFCKLWGFLISGIWEDEKET